MKQNPKLLNQYLYYLRETKNYSPKTISEYNNDLLIFFNFLRDYWEIGLEVKDFNIFIFAKVQDRDAIAFIIYLNYVRKNGASTRSRKAVAIRGFYKWLSINFPEYKITIPIKDYWIEQEIKLPKCLTMQEAEKIKGIFNINNSKNYKRNNLIVDILLTTGIRVSEVAKIKIKNINFNEKYFNVITKWNKERKVFITDKIKKDIQEYIKENNIKEYLFINKKGVPLNRRSIANIIIKAYKLAGIGNKGYTTHTLRHTSASILYQQTEDILIVKEFLGHSSIISSQIYTHIHNSKLKNAMERHPLNI